MPPLDVSQAMSPSTTLTQEPRVDMKVRHSLSFKARPDTSSCKENFATNQSFDAEAGNVSANMIVYHHQSSQSSLRTAA